MQHEILLIKKGNAMRIGILNCLFLFLACSELLNMANDETKVVSDFKYIIDNYAGDDRFLMVDGKLVFFIYERALCELPLNEWPSVIKQVNDYRPSLFITDVYYWHCNKYNSVHLRNLSKVFDGMYSYFPFYEIYYKHNMTEFYSDIVNTAVQNAKISAATVTPGYNDSMLVKDRKVINKFSREGGELFLRIWEQAMEADPDWILITSFNEWHEATEIEPSVEYGRQYIDMTRDFTRIFKEKKRSGGRSPLVMAHYYGWYQTPNFSGQWFQWKQAGHDPERLVNGQTDACSLEHPKIGRYYDSMDPDVIKYHIKLAEEMGLDAFVMSWWGQNCINRTDKTMPLMLKLLKDENSPVKISINYETNQW